MTKHDVSTNPQGLCNKTGHLYKKGYEINHQPEKPTANKKKK